MACKRKLRTGFKALTFNDLYFPGHPIRFQPRDGAQLRGRAAIRQQRGQRRRGRVPEPGARSHRVRVRRVFHQLRAAERRQRDARRRDARVPMAVRRDQRKSERRLRASVRRRDRQPAAAASASLWEPRGDADHRSVAARDPGERDLGPLRRRGQYPEHGRLRHGESDRRIHLATRWALFAQLATRSTSTRAGRRLQHSGRQRVRRVRYRYYASAPRHLPGLWLVAAPRVADP